jgi:hypothetical protein
MKLAANVWTLAIDVLREHERSEKEDKEPQNKGF